MQERFSADKGNVEVLDPPKMSFEELQKEADKHGYKLVKKRPYDEKFKPCPECGYSERNPKRDCRSDPYTLTCRSCGYQVSVEPEWHNRYIYDYKTILKLKWQGYWDEEAYTKPSYKPGGVYYHGEGEESFWDKCEKDPLYAEQVVKEQRKLKVANKTAKIEKEQAYTVLIPSGDDNG